jgi:hypothetical protein
MVMLPKKRRPTTWSVVPHFAEKDEKPKQVGEKSKTWFPAPICAVSSS